MNQYCTLFNSFYLLRGSTMISSLLENDKNAHIYVLCMDENVKVAIEKMFTERVTAIALAVLENQTLLDIKPSRTLGEYCWTLTPWIIKYCIENYQLTSCTYVDADLFFFSNPELLFPENVDKSVFLTPHNYHPKYDQSSTSGIFCVQFIKFKKDEKGLRALNWWADRCIEWCYNRIEDGKFGDQKYLDDWPSRFDGVYVQENLKATLAPWNSEKYEVSPADNGIVVSDIENQKKTKLIFYHFHEIKLSNGFLTYSSDYTIQSGLIDVVFEIYFKQLRYSADLLYKLNIYKLEKLPSLAVLFYNALLVEKEEKKRIISEYSIKARFRKLFRF